MSLMPIRFLYLKLKMRAGKIAQSVNYLLCKHEDLSLITQYPRKKGGAYMVVHAYIPGTNEEETEGILGFAGQLA